MLLNSQKKNKLSRPQSSKVLMNSNSNSNLYIDSRLFNLNDQVLEEFANFQKKRPQSTINKDKFVNTSSLAGFKRSVTDMKLNITESEKKSTSIPETEIQPYQNYSRMRPKYIKKDKESLYDENLHLRYVIKNLKSTIDHLKIKIDCMNKDIHKRQKLLDEYKNYELHKDKKSMEINHRDKVLFYNLELQNKELKKQLEEKNNEVDSLKRTSKILKVHELEIQMKAYAEEATRLRMKLQSALRKEKKFEVDDESYNFLQKCILELKQENEVLKTRNQMVENKLCEVQAKKEYDDKNFVKLVAENKKMNTNFNSMKNEVNTLVQENSELHNELQNWITLSHKPSKDQQKIEQLLEKEQQQKATIIQKEQLLAYHEKTIADLKGKLVERNNIEQREKNAMKEDLNKQKELYQELEEKYKSLLALHNIEEKRKQEVQKTKKHSIMMDDKSNSKQSFQNSESKHESKNNLYHIQNNPPNDKTPDISIENKNKAISEKIIKHQRKVNSYDVDDLGKELNLRFRLKKVSIDEVEKKLFTEKMIKKNQIRLKDVRALLMDDPFYITNPEKALLLARFLVENNDSDYVDVDLNFTNTYHYVKSKFVKNYTILNEKEEKNLKDEITKIIQKNKPRLISALKEVNEDKLDLVEEQIIRKSFHLLEIDISEKQMDYIILKLFESSNQINKLDFMKMFEIFTENVQNKDLKDNNNQIKFKKNFNMQAFMKKKIANEVIPEEN